MSKNELHFTKRGPDLSRLLLSQRDEGMQRPLMTHELLGWQDQLHIKVSVFRMIRHIIEDFDGQFDPLLESQAKLLAVVPGLPTFHGHHL